MRSDAPYTATGPPSGRPQEPRAMSETDRCRALIWTADIAAAAEILADPTTPPEQRPLAVVGILRRVEELAALFDIDLNHPST